MKDRVILIVGGTGSIGAASALAFARRGDKVIISGRDKSAASEIIEQIENVGSEARFIPCDLSQAESIEDLGQQAVSCYGHIDVAFNNAGWEGVAARLADIEESDWQNSAGCFVACSSSCDKCSHRAAVRL